MEIIRFAIEYLISNFYVIKYVADDILIYYAFTQILAIRTENNIDILSFFRPVSSSVITNIKIKARRIVKDNREAYI